MRTIKKTSGGGQYEILADNIILALSLHTELESDKLEEIKQVILPLAKKHELESLDMGAYMCIKHMETTLDKLKNKFNCNV